MLATQAVEAIMGSPVIAAVLLLQLLQAVPLTLGILQVPGSAGFSLPALQRDPAMIS